MFAVYQNNGFLFCPNSGNLGQEHAGSSAAWAGRQEEEARSGSVWWGLDSSQGAIKQCTVSKRLSERQPCAGEAPSGREGVRKGDHSSLVARAKQGFKRAKLQEKSRWSARVSWGCVCQELGIWQEPRTQGTLPSVQRRGHKGICSWGAHRTLVLWVNLHDGGSAGEAKMEGELFTPDRLDTRSQAPRLIPEPTQGWQHLSMLDNLLGSTYFYVLKIRIAFGVGCPLKVVFDSPCSRNWNVINENDWTVLITQWLCQSLWTLSPQPSFHSPNPYFRVSFQKRIAS